jgi:chemotaxis methyl-accepting protein methylase
MRLDDRDRVSTAMSSWDRTTQSRIRRRVRRLGTDRVQDVINNLTMNDERPAPE